ncbi:MAG: SDR family oxidoreductase [Pseudomonadota bacterium]
MPGNLFCFGLGLSARTWAQNLLTEGWSVAGTTRSAEKAERLAEQGFRPLIFSRDAQDPDLEDCLRSSSHLLISVAPDEAGDPVLDLYGEAIAARGAAWDWVGYLSTTGVYGDRGGDWVDEEADLQPTAPRSERRVAAERAWLKLWEEHQSPVHIFRLAGIYGPGRNALETIRRGKGKRINKPGQVFSRIHVDDIAQALSASLARPRPGRIYNVCDDCAAPPEAVIAHAAKLLGQAPPPLEDFEAADLSPMARSFYRDNKRVSNRRLHDELGVTLKYPDYQAGLSALLSEGHKP